MSDETATLDDLRDRGAALRDVASGIALAWGRVARLQGAQAALLEAVALLGAWSGRALDDPRYWDELTAIRSAVLRSLGALPDDRPGEAADLGEALTEIDDLREAALSELVARKGEAPRGLGAPTGARVDDGFVASGGVPSSHDFPVPSAELMGTEEEAEEEDEDDPPEEDDEGEEDALATLRALGAKLPERRPPSALRAESTVGEAASEERQMLEALGRSGLEDLAGLSALSAAPDDHPWAQRESFEKRLGETLDALVALARPAHPGAPAWDLTRRARAYATQWDVPDVGRAFAFCFPLCCARSEAALDWVVLALARAHPRTHVAFERALALGVHPGIDEAVRRLLEAQTDQGVLAVALRVAARRRCAPLASTLPLLAHPEPRIAMAAVEAIAVSAGEAGRAAIESLVSDRVDPTVALSASRASARLGGSRGLEYVRLHAERWATEDPVLGREAFSLLAAAGAPRDEAILLGALGRTGRVAPMVGHFGAASHVEPLIHHLRGVNDPEERSETILALHRITGLGFAAAAHEEGGSVGGVTGVTGVTFGRTSPDPMRVRIGSEPGAWQHVWGAAAPALGSARERIRFGRPFRVRDVVRELADPDTVQGVRRTLLLEAEIASSGALGLDLEDWVARQRATLELLLGAPGDGVR